MTADEREAKGIRSLPASLHSAIVAMQQDKLVMDTLGEHITGQYIAGKLKEWDSYRTYVSDWEISRYMILY